MFHSITVTVLGKYLLQFLSLFLKGQTEACVSQTSANVSSIQADTCSHCPLQAWLCKMTLLIHHSSWRKSKQLNIMFN